MSLNQLAQRCYKQAEELGWYPEYGVRPPAQDLMLVVTELAEAVEEFRKPGATDFYFKRDENGNAKPEGYSVEIADAVIRLLEFAHYRGIDLDTVIDTKLAYNKTRGFRHGGKNF